MTNAAKPTILLLPGNMCDARLWKAVAPQLEGWPTAFPALDRDDSIAAMAARVLAEHPGPIIPIGFSMGGIVALTTARLAPDRVAAIGLLGTNPSADLPERAAVRPGQQKDVRAGGLERIVVDQLMPNYLAAANVGKAELRALILDMALDLGAEVFVRQSEALRTRPDQRGVVRRLDVPAFIGCGTEDILCPPRWHRQMAWSIADAKLHIFESAGHMVPLEQPEALAAALRTWLTRVVEVAHVPVS